MKKLTVHYGLLIIILSGLGLGGMTSQATILETQAGDYYVDAINGSNATGDGSAGSPWQTITYALSQVIGPDVEIHVAAGAYNEALGESFPITMEPNVSLLGRSYTTSIISGNESNYVIHFPSTATYTETTVISGFKITGGSMGVRVDGVSGSGSSPTIQGNWIAGNNHGIYNRVSSGRRVYTVVRDNLISGNSSYGIYNHADYTKSHANPHIEGNQIVNNGSGGIYCYAAAAGDETSYCSPTISDNFISDNGGAGMTFKTYYAGACNGQIIGNTITGNQGWGIARSHTGSYLKTSRPKFINDFIFGNTTGGAQFRSGDQPTFVNSTVADNNTYGVRNGTPTIVNCIVWGHTDDLNVSVDKVSYSDVGDGEYGGVNHNISGYPQFVDPVHGDYHVSSTSPVIDAGDSTHADLPTTDFDGDPRVVGAAVDIGADEVTPDLRASTKLAPAFAAPGQTITYTIVARNDGSLDIAGAWLTDTLPALATYTSGSLSASAGRAGAANGVITWTGALSVSTPVMLTFAVTTNSSLPDSILTNTAVITHPLLNAPQRVTATTALYRVNLYTSQKTVVPERVVPGETLTYTLVISNTGIDSANAQLTDTLPAGLTVAPASLTTDVGSAGVSGQTITWTGTLGPEAVAQVQFRASTDPGVLDDTLVTNITTVADGVHPPFEIVAPSVVVGFHKALLPLLARNHFPPLFDDFSDPSSGWPEVENPGNLYEYLSGEYRIYNKTDAYEGFTSADHQLENLDASITGRRVGSARGGYGILFGTNETCSERFVFLVWPDYSEWSFLRYQTSTGYETITWYTSEAINPGTGSNRLRVVRQGNSISFWVNGVQVYNGTHTTYTGHRYVGLYATPLDAGHDARFDDYELRLP